MQLTPVMLERHLQGMIEKPRRGMTGGVREAFQESVARILVSVDRSVTIDARPGGLLALERNLTQLANGQIEPLLEPSTLSAGGRQWRLIAAP